MKTIYLDNAATTKVDPKVVKAILPYFSEKYGNASSQHALGREAKNAVENARRIILGSLNANLSEGDLIFTSGGTEANNLVLKGLFFANRNNGKDHIITTKIEHDSILGVCKMLSSEGAKITYLDVDKEGLINLKQLEESINHETLVVSIIHGNNEIGTLQNIEEIGKICKRKNVYFHIDACQSFMKSEINLKKQNIDFITLNSHKLHGPKGVGALYTGKEIKISPLFNGGGHERGLRSGTENVPAIVGFGEAVRISNLKQNNEIKKLRDYAVKEILKIKEVKLNGPSLEVEKRLVNNINVSFLNIEGEAISQYLEQEGIMISTGSACASNTLKKSHVLRAIGLNDMEINSSIRISLSRYTTKSEIDYLIKKLKITTDKLREMSPFSESK
jgi:cysteine desulfurase